MIGCGPLEGGLEAKLRDITTLEQAKANLEISIVEARAAAANRLAANQAIGSILGMGVGALIGASTGSPGAGILGAQIGTSVGSGAGTVAAS